MKKKLNLTVQADIRAAAEVLALKKRRSISQLFEDLVEAEWEKRKDLHKSSSLEDMAETYKPRRRGRTP